MLSNLNIVKNGNMPKDKVGWGKPWHKPSVCLYTCHICLKSLSLYIYNYCICTQIILMIPKKFKSAYYPCGIEQGRARSHPGVKLTFHLHFSLHCFNFIH